MPLTKWMLYETLFQTSPNKKDRTMTPVSIIAISPSADTRKRLSDLLDSLDFVQFQCADLHVKKVETLYQEIAPNIVIVDLMPSCEKAMGLLEKLNTLNPDRPSLIFALHGALEPQTMLRAMQLGVKEFIAYADEPAALEVTLRKQMALYNRFSTATPKPRVRGKLISVFSPKGGAGASTVGFNMAHEIRQSLQEPVAYFETDQVFNTIMMMLNLEVTYALGDIAKSKRDDVDDQLLRKLVVRHESGVDVLVVCKNVLDSNDMVPLPLMERALEYLLDTHSFVVVDLPSHSLDPYHQRIVEWSDQLLVVSNMELPSVYRTMQYLELVKQHLDENKVKLVLNQSNVQGAYGLSNKDLEKQFNYPIYARVSDDWDLNLKANSLGQALGQVNPQADVVKDLRKLASQITGIGGGEGAFKERSGFLNRLANLTMVSNFNAHNKEVALDAPGKA